MKKYIATLLVLISLGLIRAEAADAPQHLLKVTVPDRAAYLRLLQSGLDVPEQRPGSVMDVIATDADAEWLRGQGFGVEYEITNLARHYAQRSAGAALTMGGFRTLSEIEAAVDSLITDYPGIVSAKQTIGLSIEGRPIHAVRISDNPNVDEGEVAVLFTACHHAREVITPQILIYTMQQLAQGYGSDTLLTRLVNEREIWFITTVNPDGYFYNELTNPAGGGLWRKNRRNNGNGTRGVDLNRNYGYQWGIDNSGSSPDPSSETYRGTGPFSEPENQVIRDFCIAHPNIRIAFNYHSYSNLLLYPWGYFQGYTPDDALFAAIADSATSFNGYNPGPGWSLYLVNGDSDDWMYAELGILAFTPEVGSSQDWFWPSPNRIEPLTLENYPANIFVIDVADGPERLLAPMASVWDSIRVVGQDSLELHWSNPDTSLNAPVSYDIIELTGSQQVTDGFESGADNWQLDNSAVVLNVSAQGIASLHTGSGDNFTSHSVTEHAYTVQAGDTLSFSALYSIETDFDYAYVEVSTDGGQTFHSIPGNITTDSDPNGQNAGHGITGSSGGSWDLALFDLAAYEGQDIYVRISYVTDAFVSDFGMYVDDVSPVQVYATSTVVATSASSPVALSGYPAGSYFFKILATDAHGQTSQSATANFEYTPAYVAGDVDASGEINSGDIVYLVNYVFKAGPEPVPVAAAGDADGSGVITSADLIYMVNYVFKGGPPPVQP